MQLQLEELEEIDVSAFVADMQQAFQVGAELEGDSYEEALPKAHIMESLHKKSSKAMKVMKDNQMVGGVILDFDKQDTVGYLEFLYVKVGMQGQGIGKTIWKLIEASNPKITKWETFTPYSWKRNIHFYINVCGFQAVEFFHAHHFENDPEHAGEEYFRFEKYISR